MSESSEAYRDFLDQTQDGTPSSEAGGGKVRRWFLEWDAEGSHVIEAADGKYVLYADHVREVERWRRIAEELRNDLVFLNAETLPSVEKLDALTKEAP